MKKALSIAIVTLMLLAILVGCATNTPAATDTNSGNATHKVGVSMPTQSLQRWNQDGSNMKSQLEKSGYTVDLQYAGDNDLPTQVAQIENMIAGGCEVIVIAAIDGDALGEVLKGAKDKNIQVIAYDRLIMNTDAVAYYATFDNYKVGTMQGEYIEKVLDLKNASGPFNIELFTGDPGDNNINFFFGGAMDILTPYIDSGKLIVKSGQVEKAQAATPGWSTEKAQERMENLISAQGYGPSGTKLDAVYCSNDSTAQGVTNALVNAGYKAGADFPIITGQDCDIASTKNIIAGTQAMSIFKDTRTLASKVVEMIDAIFSGKEVPINDTKTYNNGVKVVPSFLCDPVFGDSSNYKELLIDSGYYTEDQLK